MTLEIEEKRIFFLDTDLPSQAEHVQFYSEYHRGFFIKYCQKAFKEHIKIEFQGYEKILTTDKKDDGFIVDTNDKNCMVLNVRSVKFIDFKISKVLEENDERIIIYIAPEFWVISENIF